MPLEQGLDTVARLSVAKEGHQTSSESLTTVEVLLREATDAEPTLYRIDRATGKPPTQLVLQLGTNRERKGLAETLLRKVCRL